MKDQEKRSKPKELVITVMSPTNVGFKFIRLLQNSDFLLGIKDIE